MTGGSGFVWNWGLHAPVRKGTCQVLDIPYVSQFVDLKALQAGAD